MVQARVQRLRLVPGALSRAAPQASSEAPVVITSSTSSRCLPSTAARVLQEEATCNVLPSFYPVLMGLRSRFGDARNDTLQHWPVDHITDAVAENACLVVFSFSSVCAYAMASE